MEKGATQREFFLSQVLGKPIYDSNGKLVGRLRDMAVCKKAKTAASARRSFPCSGTRWFAVSVIGNSSLAQRCAAFRVATNPHRPEVRRRS